jgi:hypothetical protein
MPISSEARSSGIYKKNIVAIDSVLRPFSMSKRHTPFQKAEQDGFGREEERYVVECGKWRGWMPPMVKGKEHDCWWVRLHVSNGGIYSFLR